MSRPIVVIVCMFGSSESWEPQQAPHQWHSRAGGGAVHSIITGLMQCSKSPLFDHLVSERKHLIWNGEAKRLGCLEIDDQIELGGLHDWQVGGFFALEDFDDVGARLAIGILKVCSIAH